MPDYRRAWDAGGTYFSTANAPQRHGNGLLTRHIGLLREVLRDVLFRHPFVIEGWVVLAAQMHCVIELSGRRQFPATLATHQGRASSARATIRRRDNRRLGLTFGAMPCGYCALRGLLVPLVFHRAGIDPTLAGGVILTTVTDVVGFFFAFLGLASVVLRGGRD